MHPEPLPDALFSMNDLRRAWISVRRWLAPEWGFSVSQYHPPPDPFNALLSFAYTLLLKDVEAKIQAVGLDSYLGFFHTLGYNRPALALDLMEEFRPTVADVVVLAMVRECVISPNDFEKGHAPELPIRMKRDAMMRLINGYEARIQEKIFHPLANGRIHLSYGDGISSTTNGAGCTGRCHRLFAVGGVGQIHRHFDI